MTRWHSPRRMAATAFRVITSAIFSEYSDARDTEAASRPMDMSGIDPCQDYSGQSGDFRFDYTADTGDGWDATHAVARLLAAGGFLSAGRICRAAGC